VVIFFFLHKMFT